MKNTFQTKDALIKKLITHPEARELDLPEEVEPGDQYQYLDENFNEEDLIEMWNEMEGL